MTFLTSNGANRDRVKEGIEYRWSLEVGFMDLYSIFARSHGSRSQKIAVNE